MSKLLLTSRNCSSI